MASSRSQQRFQHPSTTPQSPHYQRDNRLSSEAEWMNNVKVFYDHLTGVWKQKVKLYLLNDVSRQLSFFQAIRKTLRMLRQAGFCRKSKQWRIENVCNTSQASKESEWLIICVGIREAAAHVKTPLHIEKCQQYILCCITIYIYASWIFVCDWKQRSCTRNRSDAIHWDHGGRPQGYPLHIYLSALCLPCFFTETFSVKHLAAF